MPNNNGIALLKISRFPHPDYPREAGNCKNIFPRQKPAGLRSLVVRKRTSQKTRPTEQLAQKVSVKGLIYLNLT